jgi:phenylacetate-CoA ligase
MNTLASQKVIDLFHKVYETSPAYRDFIKKHKVKVADISTPADITKIPITDKHNYINVYPLEDRLYGGKKISDFYMISASSGSSGEPTFWARDLQIDEKLAEKKELMFDESFGIRNKRTLCIVNLALGAWTGGMLTAKLSWEVSRNQQLTVVTPGVNKEVTAAMIKKLHKFYDQIIILGYPPFVRDLIDFLDDQRIDLKKLNIKIMCTAEKFSERWRNYIAEKVSSKNSRHDVISFYACSDAGILGCETQETIDILDRASKDSKLSLEIFGVEDTPAFFRYDPAAKYLESVNGEILISADQPVPLIRYNIHDRGGILEEKKVQELFGKPGNYIYVHGRGDAVLFTANIYIDDVKYCLEKSKFHSKFSGHFQYGVEETKTLRKKLVIHIFLKKGASLTSRDKKYFQNEFTENLFKVNDDLKVLTGVKLEKFKFVFKPEDPNKFKHTKIKYFL